MKKQVRCNNKQQEITYNNKQQQAKRKNNVNSKTKIETETEIETKIKTKTNLNCFSIQKKVDTISTTIFRTLLPQKDWFIQQMATIYIVPGYVPTCV